MAEQEQQMDQTVFSNNRMGDASFLQIRLNTNRLLQDIELFLSAKKPVVKEREDGSLYETYDVVGSPLANETGVTHILNIIRLSMMNEHIVQGNLKHDEFLNLCADSRKELTDAIVQNCYEWGVSDSNLSDIVNTIMRFFKLFLSRTIENKERESYMQQFVSRETVSQSERGGVRNFIGGLGRNANH